MSDKFIEIQERMKSLAKAWDEAECTMKLCSADIVEAPGTAEGGTGRAETVGQSGYSAILQPSILELRYAGRRVMDAVNAGLLETDDPSKIRNAIDYIADARFCCLRARHDCIDSVIFFARGLVYSFEAEFSRDRLEKYGDGYIRLNSHLNDAKKLIAESRRDRESRADLYKKIEDKHISHILAGASDLLSARGTLLDAVGDESVLVEKLRRQSKQSLVYAVIGGAIGVIGCAIGLFALVGG